MRGACCRRRRSCRRSSTDQTPASATALVATLLADNQKYRRALDFVLERSPAQRGRRHATSPRPPAARASPTGCSAALEVEPAVRPVRHEAAQSVDAGRSRRIPGRRQLARRNERRGDAVDAGVAEHRAGLPRRQSEVQLVPRQLRQQVEAEGRVRPRRLLRARSEAADVPLRRRARIATRSRGFSSRNRAHAPASESLADRRAAAAAIFTDRAHRPAAAHAGQPRLAAPARPRHRRATPTRWTASRGAPSSSTGWPATSSITGTTSST